MVSDPSAVDQPELPPLPVRNSVIFPIKTTITPNEAAGFKSVSATYITGATAGNGSIKGTDGIEPY